MLRRLLEWLRTERGDGTFRDVVPDWQYGSGGRLHGGGIARDQQERADEDVAEQADRLSAVDER